MRSSLLALVLLGCGSSSSSEPSTCFDAGTNLAACTPAYEPTYDAIYANTFQKSCAAAGVSCHASTGRQGNIDFSEPNRAYADIMARAVKADSPECSVLVERVIATDGKVRMPPGRSLPAGEACAIIQWIASGAKR